MPEIPPHKYKASARNTPQPLAVQGTENLPNPFQTDDSGTSGTKIALRTEEEQQAKFAALVSAAEAERKALQIRRALVARRRELLPELSVRKEEEQASRRAEFLRKQQEEETRKAAQELRNKELERARREVENIRVEEAKKLAQSLKEKGTLKVDINVSFFRIAVQAGLRTHVMYRTWRA